MGFVVTKPANSVIVENPLTLVNKYIYVLKKNFYPGGRSYSPNQSHAAPSNRVWPSQASFGPAKAGITREPARSPSHLPHAHVLTIWHGAGEDRCGWRWHTEKEVFKVCYNNQKAYNFHILESVLKKRSEMRVVINELYCVSGAVTVYASHRDQLLLKTIHLLHETSGARSPWDPPLAALTAFFGHVTSYTEKS